MSDFLARLGRADLIDDVTLITAELVANAIMHARTELTLSIEPTAAGICVTVTDGSRIMPRWSPPSATATAGRGLALVKRVSDSWGFDPLPEGGKRVWAEIDAPLDSYDERSADDLLEFWAGEPWPGDLAVNGGIPIDIDIDVRPMLDSRAHTEEIVRDLQLTLLDAADAGTETEARTEVVRLARRLDVANEEFHDGRRQMYNQTISADRLGKKQTTLHLRLHRTDEALARRWLEALDEADAMTTAGTLLLPPFPPELTEFRRCYINAIIEKLQESA